MVQDNATASTGLRHDRPTLRNLLGHYPTGVCAITALDAEAQPVAMVVGTFTSVSLDPPLIGFLPAHSSATWPVLRQSGRFCVNILAANQAPLCGQLSSKSGDRFEGIKWRPSPSGDPILEGVVGWIDCRIEDVCAAGDHDFVLCRVLDIDMESQAEPLVFHRGALGRVA